MCVGVVHQSNRVIISCEEIIFIFVCIEKKLSTDSLDLKVP